MAVAELATLAEVTNLVASTKIRSARIVQSCEVVIEGGFATGKVIQAAWRCLIPSSIFAVQGVPIRQCVAIFTNVGYSVRIEPRYNHVPFADQWWKRTASVGIDARWWDRPSLHVSTGDFFLAEGAKRDIARGRRRGWSLHLNSRPEYLLIGADTLRCVRAPAPQQAKRCT